MMFADTCGKTKLDYTCGKMKMHTHKAPKMHTHKARVNADMTSRRYLQGAYPNADMHLGDICEMSGYLHLFPINILHFKRTLHFKLTL